MKLSELSVGPNHDGGYSVLFGDLPMGTMLDFYRYAKKVPVALAQNRYPFSTEKNCFPDLASAESALERTKAHVRAVINMNPKIKIGSSQYWTE